MARRCEEVRELAPEVALGIADGKERAEALAHLSSCAACRAHLAELTELADDLLALTPAEEPPAGFETRVVKQLGLESAAEEGSESAQRGGRVGPRRLVLAALAACLVGIATTATALLVAFDDDRQLAGEYRATLDRVGGEYFQATLLHNAAGTPVGQVFGYQGEPSWLFVVVYAPHRESPLTASLVTTAGERVALPAVHLDADRGTWGGEIPVDLDAVNLVRLVDRRGAVYETPIPGR